MITPANIKIQLRKEEATLLMLAFDAGVLHLDCFNSTATSIMGMKSNPERHKEMMEKLLKLQGELINQLYKEKSPIITAP